MEHAKVKNTQQKSGFPVKTSLIQVLCVFMVLIAACSGGGAENSSLLLHASVSSWSAHNASEKHSPLVSPLASPLVSPLVSVIVVDARLFKDYQQAAEVMAEAAVRDHWSSIVSCEDVYKCLPETIDKLALDLFHRPISPSERERYMSLFNDGGSQTLYSTGTKAEKGIRIILETMLQSPHFIYRQDFNIAKMGQLSEASNRAKNFG